MKRVCITINLKIKIQRMSSKYFEYFIEEHVNNKNFEKITKRLLDDNIKFIYIEELCLQNLINVEEVINFFKANKIKVIIIYIKKNNGIFSNCNVDLIDIMNNDFDNKILEYESVKKEKFKARKEKMQKFKFLDNTILAMSLDRKLYMTTYLLNLISMYKGKKVLFVEIKQSLIDYKSIVNYEKVDLEYKVVRNIKEVECLKYNKYDKVIIDFGYIYNIKYVQQMLKNLNIPILVFETSCIKVMENQKYIQIVRLLEKYNNVFFINREEIFDKIVQENLDPFKSKTIKKHIKKNKLGEWKC